MLDASSSLRLVSLVGFCDLLLLDNEVLYEFVAGDALIARLALYTVANLCQRTPLIGHGKLEAGGLSVLLVL